MNSSARFFTPPVEGQGQAVKAGILIKGVASEVRQNVHMIFVIDISDSMADDRKLLTVKKSMEFLVPLLGDGDIVSVITFGETSDVLLNRISAAEKDAILYTIKGLQTDGCTNMSAALMNIRLCLDGPTAAATPDGAVPPQPRKTGVIMLTDGHANRGASHPDMLKEIVGRIVEENADLTVTTVGYGHEHYAALLQDMATIGKGSYNVVYNLEHVATTFGEVLGGLTTVVAQNVVVHLPPGCKVFTGYSVVERPNGVKEVRIGDIYAENEIIVLFEAGATAGERLVVSGNAGITEVRVTGHDMITHEILDQMVAIAVPPVGDGIQGIPKNFEQAHYRYEVSKLLKDTAGRSSGLTNEELKAKAEGLLAQLKGLTYASEQLIQIMIDDMEGLIETLSIPRMMPSALETSQMTQHSAYLALGRGLRVASSQAPAAEDPQPHVRFAGFPAGPPAPMMRTSSMAPATAAAVPPPPMSVQRTAQVDNLASPFSNRAQRNVTSVLRASSQQPFDASGNAL
jgi:Mg-chelatase subunit ChlD